MQVVNCEHEEIGDNVFKLKYAKSRRQKGQRSFTTSLQTCKYMSASIPVSGKRVFKKPVKFLIKFVPAETMGEGDDGRTFVVTFVQTNGEKESV